MPPAARKGDNHGACPGIHVGGAIQGPCAKKVYIGKKKAARVTDKAKCQCGGPDPIVKGSRTVLIENKMAARIDDPTAHGGKIVQGEPTVIIGDNAQGNALSKAASKGKGVVDDCG
jgi:uncharacterized Zn-binding protein involved in type VI secretion